MHDRKNRRNPEKTKRNVLHVKEPVELMNFIINQLQGKSRSAVKSHLSHRQVMVDGQVVTQFNYMLRPGQTVEIFHGLVAQDISYPGLKIMYEDKYIVVINKNSGLLSIATDNSDEMTAYSTIRQHVKISDFRNKIFIVHRLDRDTSGVMMFVKSEEIKNKIQMNWTDIVIERSYLVIVEGQVENNEGKVTSWLKENAEHHVYSSQTPNDGDLAVTHYRVLDMNKKFTLLEASLDTGRKNQIRVHMQDMGHPVVGDKRYGATVNPLGRLGLHAQLLTIVHPVTGQQMRFSTPIPRKFSQMFENQAK